MACGSKKAFSRKTLVKISTDSIVESRSVSVQKVGDFHCGECGLTLKKREPSFKHICTGPPAVPINYQRHRLAKCSTCDQNKEGVCQEYKRQHPDRDCNIEVGVKIPYAACPLSKWWRVLIKCPQCESDLFHVDGPSGCRYCGWSRSISHPDTKILNDPKPGTVGFLSVAYMDIGGVETWHQTLIPALDNVVGFSVTSEIMSWGDLSLLGCPAGVGFAHAKHIAENCETLVVWGIGKWLGDILMSLNKKPKVISVSHSDKRSLWTTQMMHEQEPWSDHAVYICPSGLDTVPVGMHERSTYIPNAPSPDKVKEQIGRKLMREKLGVKDEDILLLTVSRINKEKQVAKLAEAVSLMPSNYRLFVIGSREGWNHDYSVLVRDAGGDKCTLVQATNEIGDYFAASDAVLSASEFEGFGLSIAEGMLAKRPVLGTPVGLLEASPELARIVPLEATPKDWAVAIEKDFSSLEDQRERVSRSYSVISTEYSVERFVQSWKDLLAKI